MNIQKSAAPIQLNVIDLFCGAGGLACGFHLHNGSIKYRTRLGIDVDPAAIRTFNDNFTTEMPDAPLGLGRLSDVTWFSHPAEIRLFYLSHLALTSDENDLRASLEQGGFLAFLAAIRQCDSDFSEQCEELVNSSSYAEHFLSVPNATSTLAIVKAFTAFLGLRSLSSLKLAHEKLPWADEYLVESAALAKQPTFCAPELEDLRADAAIEWNERLERLEEAAAKTGRGQHSKNAERISRLLEFLLSSSGKILRDHWIDWRSRRNAIRAEFCLRSSDLIESLYSGERRVHVVLGGPPCKGFSRIGRPVIESLRNQGVHAWSHKQYGDERNALMCQYVLFLEALAPDAFIFENVANFNSVLRTPEGEFDAVSALRELIAALSDVGHDYHVAHRILNARKFAVPQDRRRFILFGVNSAKAEETVATEFFNFGLHAGEVSLGAALEGLGDAREVAAGSTTERDVLTDVFPQADERLPSSQLAYRKWVEQADPRAGLQPEKTTGHIYRRPRADDATFIKFVAPGVRWMDLKVNKSETLGLLRDLIERVIDETTDPETREMASVLSGRVDGSLLIRLLLEHTKERFNLSEQHLLLPGYLKNGGSTHGDWLERLSATKPCRTIVAHIGKDTYAYWHPTEPRALTVREAARVQSFPDYFRFTAAGFVDTYTIIGNAVPPLLANKFAERLETLESRHRLFSQTPKRRTEKAQAASSQLSFERLE